MHNVVRGYGDEETQQLGPILEGSTKLQEPLSSWFVDVPTKSFTLTSR